MFPSAKEERNKTPRRSQRFGDFEEKGCCSKICCCCGSGSSDDVKNHKKKPVKGLTSDRTEHLFAMDSERELYGAEVEDLAQPAEIELGPGFQQPGELGNLQESEIRESAQANSYYM